MLNLIIWKEVACEKNIEDKLELQHFPWMREDTKIIIKRIKNWNIYIHLLTNRACDSYYINFSLQLNIALSVYSEKKYVLDYP